METKAVIDFLLDRSAELSKKAEVGEAVPGPGQLFTPENSPEPPEPPELPDESNKDQSERTRRLENLIKHILDADPKNPFNVLGVKSTDDFKNRVPNQKKFIQSVIGSIDGAKDAFDKVVDAENKVTPYFEASKNEVQRVLSLRDASYAEILLGDDERQAYGQMVLLNPEYNKNEGAKEALKIVQKAWAEARDNKKKLESKDNSPTNRPIPDETTRSLYDEATPFIAKMLEDFEDFQMEAAEEVDKIKEKIREHNLKNMSEDDAEELMIKDADIVTIAGDGSEDLAELRKNPSNDAARERLEEINRKLSEFNKEHHYPPEWKIKLPPKPTPVQPPNVRPGGLLSGMLGSKSVSTAIEVACPAGSTPEGGRIIRYSEFFVPSEKKREEGKEPRYNFLVWDDGLYYLKTGKEIGDAAKNAYLSTSSKVKIGEYYGEKHFGVKYSRQYFNRLRGLEQQEGVQGKYILWLGAARRSSMTKTGRTMPPEYCVIGINDPDKNAEWYDVFTRSAFTRLYGNDAGHRFDEYWRALNEEPSRRKELVDESTPKSKSQTGSSSSGGVARWQVDDITKQVESLRSEVAALKSKPPETDKAIKEEVTSLRREVNDLKSLRSDISEMKEMMLKMMNQK